MKQRIRLTESDLHRIVKESVKKIVEDTKAQRKKDPMNQWFKDMDDIQKHRDNMEYITKGGRKPEHWNKCSNKKALREGTTDMDIEEMWDNAKEMMGADSMLDALYTYLDCDTIEDFVQTLIDEYELPLSEY